MTERVARGLQTGVVPRWLLPTLVLLFFFSGISALVYQVLWLRLFTLVFGVTVHAASAVLASFMTGLALGSVVAGRLADRAGNPLRWFACAEAAIGLSALLTPIIMGAADQLYVTLYPVLPEGPASVTLVRFLLALAILLIPTTMMGATLPLVVKSSLTQLEGIGQRVGLLYASNTAGAIAGTLLGGFVLVGGIGITASFQLAAALNGLVALVAALASRSAKVEALPRLSSDLSAASMGPVGVASTERARKMVLLVFALSGVVSLGLEVIWFRMLVLFFEATTYAFTIMLAAVLSGLAAGSYLVTPLLRRRRDLLPLLAIIQLAIGVASAISLAAAHTHLTPSLEPLAGELAPALVISVLVVFPPTLLMGIAFPIGLFIWAGGVADAATRTGERIGLFYALNVCGGICGSVAAGFLLLPWLGIRSSIVSLASLSIVSGLLLLTALPPDRRRFKLATGALGASLFLVAALTVPNPFALVLGHRHSNEQFLWREEGVQTTASVHVRPGVGRILYLDGLHQANDSSEMVRVHRQIGHLAVLLHAQPRRALVIGLGGGVTAGAVSQHAGVDVDIVELSQAVVRASAWFRHCNYDVLRQPNVHLRVDDGRNYLRVTDTRYDVITADIIEPFHAGAGNLYSAEYFALVRQALKDDGLILQWIGHRPEAHYKLIMRTFLRVFPHATLWADGTLMVAMKQPLRIGPTAIARQLQEPTTREALAAIGITDFESVLPLYTAGPEELHRFAGSGPILTDDRPMVEYYRVLPRQDRLVDLSGIRSDPWQHVDRF
jgi:spermidine synthase